MPLRGVVLVPGAEVGWPDLRTSLHALADVRLVDEMKSVDDVDALVRMDTPDAILAATKVGGTSTLPLLNECRRHAPNSRILLFTSRYTAEDLAAFAEFGTAGFLLWSDLTRDVLHDVLAALLSADLHISSQAAVDAFMKMQHDPLHGRSGQVQLTKREHAVLRQLAEGQTQKQIADAEYLSERTVKRTVESLERKLDAPSQFMLGARAAQLGLIP